MKKIATVVLKQSHEEHLGETRRAIKTSVRLVPIEIESQVTSERFIETEETLSGSSVVGVHAAHVDLNFASIASEPKKPQADGMKFTLRKFSVLGVCELAGEIVLVPLGDGTTDLPSTATILGSVACEVYAVSAQDSETAQTYKLGFLVPGTPEVDWAPAAHARRKQFQRQERELNAEPKEQKYAGLRYTTYDQDFIDAIKAEAGYAKIEIKPDGEAWFAFDDIDAWQRCYEIEKEVTQKRFDEVRTK